MESLPTEVIAENLIDCLQDVTMLTTGECAAQMDMDNSEIAKAEAKAWLMELLHRANVVDASPVPLARVEPCHVQRFSQRQREQKMQELKRLRSQWQDIRARLYAENQDCISDKRRIHLKQEKRQIKTQIQSEMEKMGEDPQEWLAFTAESDDLASSYEDACCVYTRADLLR